MAKAVTTSKPMTEKQIERVLDKFRTDLRKYRAEFSSTAVQTVLGAKQVGQDLLKTFRTHVEVVSNLIVRTTTVLGTRTAEEAISATGRKQYVTPSVVKAMPRGEDGEVEVVFFKYGKDIKDDLLDAEYTLRGLVPADPFALAAVNEADPAFADEHPNCTHWKNAEGKWCYAAFRRWYVDERYVDVDQHGRHWHDYWWFAGVRK